MIQGDNTFKSQLLQASAQELGREEYLIYYLSDSDRTDTLLQKSK